MNKYTCEYSFLSVLNSEGDVIRCFKFLLRLPHNHGQEPGIVNRNKRFLPQLPFVGVFDHSNRNETRSMRNDCIRVIGTSITSVRFHFLVCQTLKIDFRGQLGIPNSLLSTELFCSNAILDSQLYPCTHYLCSRNNSFPHTLPKLWSPQLGSTPSKSTFPSTYE